MYLQRVSLACTCAATTCNQSFGLGGPVRPAGLQGHGNAHQRRSSGSCGEVERVMLHAEAAARTKGCHADACDAGWACSHHCLTKLASFQSFHCVFTQSYLSCRSSRIFPVVYRCTSAAGRWAASSMLPLDRPSTAAVLSYKPWPPQVRAIHAKVLDQIAFANLQGRRRRSSPPTRHLLPSVPTAKLSRPVTWYSCLANWA